MQITIPLDQQKWLEDAVAAGAFASIDDAVSLALAGLIDAEPDDLGWAQPLVDDARASVASGRGIALADAKAAILARLATPRRLNRDVT